MPDKLEFRKPAAVEDIKDDRLGRKSFVKHLAEAIRRYNGGKSLTIGLHGPWGSGKSTLLNFVAQELKSDNIVVGRFNPWNFSDNDRLLSSYFRFFAGLLRHKENGKQLRTAASWIDGLAELAEPAGNIADLLSLPISLIPGGGAAIEGGKAVAKMLKARAAKLSDVEHLKAEISKVLRDSNKRFVIIIDDLDRLPQHEIRQVFQLLKASADFDNVVYLVAFERGIVSKALDKFAEGEGERYLEKVINIPFNLPQMTTRQIRRLVIEDLNEYTERQREYDWNNQRLQAIIEALTPYFTTLRLIDMLTNLLIIMEEMVKHDVDFTDHFGLTMLQVLEPRVHEFIGKNQRLFVDTTENRLLRDKDADKTERAEIELAFKDLQFVSQEKAIDALSAIFPKVKRLFDSGSNEFGKRTWYIEQRACADYELFSRYFRFEVDEADLSAKDVAALVAATQDRDALKLLFVEAKGNTERIHRMLERLGDMASPILPPKQIANIFYVLFDVVDDLPEVQGIADIFYGPINEAANSMFTILRKMPNQAERAKVVCDALREMPRSLALVTTLVERGTAQQRKYSQEQPLFAAEDAPEIRTLASAVIEARFTDHSIFDYPRGVAELYSWFRLAPDRSSDVVRGLTDDDDGLFMRFVGMFDNLQLGAFRPTPMDLKTLAAIWPMEDIGARLERIENRCEGEPANGVQGGLHALWQEQMNIINRPDVEDKADDAEGSPEGWAVVTDDIAGAGPESTGTRHAGTGDFEEIPIMEGS